MKTFTNRLGRTMMLIASLMAVSPQLFADGSTAAVYLTGTTESPAGDYVVLNTEELYYYNGNTYDVYLVQYENLNSDLKIAVHTGKECNSFIATNGKFTFFYSCDENGFGIRRVMFNNPLVKESFSPEQFHCQSVICKKRRINRPTAVETVACFVPQLYKSQGGN
jgi:hypothetical protein